MKRLVAVLFSWAAMGGTAAAGTVEVAYPFFDDVEDGALSASRWQMPEGGWVRVTADGPDGGAWAWQSSADNPQRHLVLAEPLDLTGAVNPYLSVWLRNVDGRVVSNIEISSDGGTSWIRLGGDSHSGGDWTNLQFRLVAFRSAAVLLRFSAASGVTGAVLWIDRILLDDAPKAVQLSTSAPTNHGITLSWQPSSARDFGHFLLVLDTRDIVGARNPDNPPLLSGRRERRLITIKNPDIHQLVLTDLTFVGQTYFAHLFEVDLQGLRNEGSGVVEFSTALEPATEIAPFSQGFNEEHGWVGDRPWGLYVDDSDAVLQDSPDHIQNSYEPLSERYIYVRVNFNRVARPLLYFDHHFDFESRRDFGGLAYSTDGQQWTDIVEFTGLAREWRTETIDLSFLGRRVAFLRFGVVAQNSFNQGNGWTIDNVTVKENDYRTDYGFFDNVESDASLDYWIASSQWSRSAFDGYSGDFSWGMQPLSSIWNYLTLAGPVDLSLVANPRLSFWVRSVNNRVFFAVQASRDGGGTWEDLVTPRPTVSNVEWEQKVFDLSPFFGDQMLVRFGANQVDVGATLLIDDIRLDFPPTILGDASGDNEVGTMDAVLVLQHAVGLVELVGGLLAAADVSGNGRVTAYDATLILQYIAGLITAFPAETLLKPALAAGRLGWGEMSAGPQGQTVVAPLVLEEVVGQVRSAELELPLPAQAEVVEVQSALPADWQVVEHRGPGGLTLALAGTTPLPPGVLAQLVLKVDGGFEELALAGRGALNEAELELLSARGLESTPHSFALEQNWPNPFNSATVIRFSLEQAGLAQLAVYNLAGQKVASLVEGPLAAGRHQLQWDGRDRQGRLLASGVYLYRLAVGDRLEVRRLLLLK